MALEVFSLGFLGRCLHVTLVYQIRVIFITLFIIGKMVVRDVNLPAGVAASCPALAPHHVAAIFFHKALAAFVAFSHHCIGYKVFDKSPHGSFRFVLYFVASEWDVVRLQAESARFLETLGVQALEHLVVFVHYGGEGAEGARHQAWDVGRRHFLLYDTTHDV